MARSSISLFPASDSAGLLVAAERPAGSSDAAVAAGKTTGSFEGGGGTTGARSAADADGVARGRVEVDFAGWVFGAAGWDAVNLRKSSRMFRGASQAVKSNKPIPTVRVNR